MIFIDLSVPEPIATAIKVIRNDVAYLYDIYQPPSRTQPILVPDSEWLARAGREGWLVISRDEKIRYRPGERRAILENNVGAFILAHKEGLKKWPYFRLLVCTLDEMERRFAHTPRPFIYLINGSGIFTPVHIKPIT